MKRRTFNQKAALSIAGMTLLPNIMQAAKSKKRIALVGTGIRGITFWGKSIHPKIVIRK